MSLYLNYWRNEDKLMHSSLSAIKGRKKIFLNYPWFDIARNEFTSAQVTYAPSIHILTVSMILIINRQRVKLLQLATDDLCFPYPFILHNYDHHFKPCREWKDFSLEQVTYASANHIYNTIMILTINHAREKRLQLGTGDLCSAHPYICHPYDPHYKQAEDGKGFQNLNRWSLALKRSSWKANFKGFYPSLLYVSRFFLFGWSFLMIFQLKFAKMFDLKQIINSRAIYLAILFY